MGNGEQSSKFFDAVVVGSGPAGSLAAMELARLGASVALVDKADFPRDKACGDLVGPRAVALLEAINLVPQNLLQVGNMAVTGPSGNQVILPATAGRTFPGRAWSIPRKQFDAHLHQAAIAKGAVAVVGRVSALNEEETCSPGVRLDDGRIIRADFVVGADGATSTVGRAAKMAEDSHALWGFALRAYAKTDVDLPIISLLETNKEIGFPGYGWIFPGPNGQANLGLGVGAGNDRKRGAMASRRFEDFVSELRTKGHLGADTPIDRRLGGWLKMGMIGTRPARGRVLLVGDAAGLVNPLQGEGIAQAMLSGVAAAQAIAHNPSNAAATYSAWLRRHHATYHGTTAVLQSSLLGRPRAVSKITRTITAPGFGSILAPSWGLYWNELLEGSSPGIAASMAQLANVALRVGTSASPQRRNLKRALRWA